MCITFTGWSTSLSLFLPLSPFPPAPVPPGALIATWREKGCTSFWRVLRQYPLLRSHIQCWKACFVIHRSFRDGHPDVRENYLSLPVHVFACPIVILSPANALHVVFCFQVPSLHEAQCVNLCSHFLLIGRKNHGYLGVGLWHYSVACSL